MYLACLRARLGQLLDSLHNCNKSIELPNSHQIGPNWSVVPLSKESIWLDSDCTWLVSGLDWDSYWTAYIIVTRMDGRTDGWTDGRTAGRTDGRLDGRTDGWTDGRTDGWTDGRTDCFSRRQPPSQVYDCAIDRGEDGNFGFHLRPLSRNFFWE